MATLPTGNFDLYYVMVEVLFGNVLVSGIAMAFLIMVICLLGRMSLLTTFIWLGLFLMVFSVVYIKAFALVLFFIVGLIYFSISLIRFIFPDT